MPSALGEKAPRLARADTSGILAPTVIILGAVKPALLALSLDLKT